MFWSFWIRLDRFLPLDLRAADFALLGDILAFMKFMLLMLPGFNRRVFGTCIWKFAKSYACLISHLPLFGVSLLSYELESLMESECGIVCVCIVAIN